MNKKKPNSLETAKGKLNLCDIKYKHNLNKVNRTIVSCMDYSLYLLENDLFLPVVQFQFYAYYLIWVSKKLFIQALCFHPCSATSINYLLQLLKILRY